MTHIERKQREKEEIRKSIIDAAIGIAAKEGWHTVTIRKIADAIEYTPPIVYEYFESKDDLLKEIIYLGFDILTAGFENSIKKEISPRKFLELLSISQWDFAGEHKEIYQLMFSLERPAPNDKMKVHIQIIERYFSEIAHGNKESAMEYMANWICLMQGAISTMMILEMPPEFSNIDKRQLYIKMIHRFLEHI
jgi:AcrR family transcriptional regulator